MEPFPELSPRLAEYRDRILRAPYEVYIERARCVTQAWREHEGEHPAIRAALAFERTTANMTLAILDCERIVGNRTSKLVGTAIPVERGDINVVLEMDLDLLEKRARQPYHITDADRRELTREILPYWRGRSMRDGKKRLWKKAGLAIGISLSPWSVVRRMRSLDARAMMKEIRSFGFRPSYLIRGPKELAYNNPAIVNNVFDVQGHMVLGHKNVLPVGFAGIEEQARARLARCRAENDGDGAAFCEAVQISCRAIQDLAARYAALARENAAKEPDGTRRAELLAIAGRCDRVPAFPPRDFREAVQSLWLTQVGALVAYGMGALFALGRVDQLLWPYYRDDLAAGRITEGEARELLAELLIKTSCNLLMIPAGGKSTGSELGADNEAITVGGVDRDGCDATNDLSYLFLEASAGLRSMVNSFSIRVSETSPPEWTRRVAQLFSVTSGPAVFNDEAIVPSLIGCGYALEDARDYAIVGCVEQTGDGDTFGCTSGNDISLVGALEMTLFRGRLWVVGKRVGPDTGDPRAFATFDEFLAAYKRQVRFLTDLVARATDLKDQVYAEGFPNPFVSATVAGCLDRARDLTQGGAKYDFSSISARGLGTVADSLAAIRRFVYEEKKVSMAELLAALKTNFRGHEPLRQMLRTKAPKFGRDDDAADALAKDVAETFCREVAERPAARGGVFRPSFFSYGMHVMEGSFIGATPDGRLAGAPVSNSLSPTNGADSRGPTAVFRSLAKIDHTLISNGCALNVRLRPSLVAGAERIEKLAQLVRGYFAMGGMEVQFNVVDTQTLRDAQAHPENHRGLVVRVSGYSAYFTDLGTAIQNEIIARTAHGEF